MTLYNLHIYREMRLTYRGIEAESHEAAAQKARDLTTDHADSIDDCNGETFAALVDVAGDEEYAQSRLIDFEPERQSTLREALDQLLSIFDEEIAQGIMWNDRRIRKARAAMAATASLAPGPNTARPDPICVEVDHRFVVAIDRAETDLFIRIYPRTNGEVWDEPFTTFEVDEAEIIALEKDMEA